MSEFKTVAVPFQTRGNRQILTHKQLMETPWLVDFVGRFPKCFEWNAMCDILVFYPEADAPEPYGLVSL